jgi:predicted Zn finger-like uncharacterized protein
MSFTTRCPACGTMFRLEPDHLKMADGWVQCGHCADVFDATLYLEAPTGVAPTAASEGGALLDSLHATELGVPQPGAGGRVDAHEREWQTESDSVSVARWLRAAEGVPAARPSVRAPDAFQVAGVDFQIDFEIDVPQPTSPAVASHLLAASDAPKDSGSTDPEPDFVRQARRRAFWQSPGMRALLSLLALVLGLGLLLQWAVHERNTLAAWEPRLAPALTQLCASLGCEVAPVRRIDAIVIDSSALVRRLGNFYAFDVVLKNTAPVAVAMPALELSLTDARDAVLARRVFLPAELPGARALLPAQDTLAISLRLSLAVGEAIPMAGYRVLVFYP